MRVWIGILLGLLARPALGATYYVDSGSGSDSADGRASDRAWRTLDAVNVHTFAAGDAILFKAGTTYTPTGSQRLGGIGRADRRQHVRRGARAADRRRR